MRDMGKKERERRALLSCAGWPVSFENLVFDMVCLWNEGESQQSQSLLLKLGSQDCEAQCQDRIRTRSVAR